MDLRGFYQKIARAKEMIPTPFAVVVSADTPDGGRAGLLSEVAREVAARLIVEGRARLASESEALNFYADRAEAARLALEREAQQTLKVALLSDRDLEAVRIQLKQSHE